MAAWLEVRKRVVDVNLSWASEHRRGKRAKPIRAIFSGPVSVPVRDAKWSCGVDA